MKLRFRLPGFWILPLLLGVVSLTAVSAASAAPGVFGAPVGGPGLPPSASGAANPVDPADAPPGIEVRDGAAARATMARVAREQKRRDAKRREFLGSARARSERKLSRSAFRDLSDGGALALFKQKFSGALRPGVPDARTLVGRDRVVEFIGDHVARVEGSDGRPDRLIDASIPLRAVDEGRKQLVDLDLERKGGGFVANNGLVGVRLPATAGDAVRFGPLGVTPPGTGAAVKLDADTLAYPNAATDTDVAVNLTTAGFEVFHQLRSPEAAEVQRYRLDLPAGAVLRATDADGAEIVQNGDVKVIVQAPFAVDAQGEAVPASYRIDGNVLEVVVRHRSRDVAYPVLLDPEFQAVDNYACNYGTGPCDRSWFKGDYSALQRLSHWEWAANTTAQGYGYHKQCFNYPWFNDCYGPAHGGGSNWNLGGGGDGRWSVGQTGLHVIVYPNAWYQGGWELGYWGYDTPVRSDDPHARTTQIYRIDFGAKFLRKRSSPAYPIMFTGIFSWKDWDWASAIHHNPGPMANDAYGGYSNNWHAEFGTSRPGPQRATFGFTNPGATYLTQYRDAYMGAAIIQLTDPEPPSISEADPTLTENGGGQSASKWTRNGVFTFAPRAKDPGLGVRRIRLSYTNVYGQTVTQERNAYCTGTKSSPCEDDLKLPYQGQSVFTLNAASSAIPEGQIPVTIRAADALGSGSDQNGRQHETTITKTIKVDRTGPSISPAPTGTLYENRNRTHDHRREGLYDQLASLHVEATDGSAASNSSQRSGVKSIRLLLDRDRNGSFTDSEELAQVENPCSGGCPYGGTLDYQLDTDSLPNDGKYNVKVVASDLVGNLTELQWEVVIDRRGDVFQAEEYTDDPDVGGELISVEAARLNTHIARQEAPDRVSTRGVVPCDDNNPGGSQCGEVRYRTLDSQFDPGAQDTFSRIRGTGEEDPHLPQVASILDPADFIAEGRSADSSGPLTSVLQAWQRPPPAHGEEYELFEFSEAVDVDSSEVDDEENEPALAVSRIWVDGATKMPMKSTYELNGQELINYWTYDADRAEAENLPSDYFLVSEPNEADMTNSTTFHGPSGADDSTDRQTGTTFEPYYLGQSFSGEELDFCLDTTATFRHLENVPRGDVESDPDATSRDLADITRIDAVYELLPPGSACQPGGGPGEDLTAQVSSFARSSEIAAAYRDEIVATATAIELDPLDEERPFGGITAFFLDQPRTAYAVAREGGGTIALVEVGDSLILVKTPFSKASLPALLENLETQR